MPNEVASRAPGLTVNTINSNHQREGTTRPMPHRSNPAHQRLEVLLDPSDAEVLDRLVSTYNMMPPFNKKPTINSSDVIRRALRVLDNHVATQLPSIDDAAAEMGGMVELMLKRRLGRGRGTTKKKTAEINAA